MTGTGEATNGVVSTGVIRVLIIDDASPDNTPEVAGQLAAIDPRITYVRNETNLGLIGTANKHELNRDETGNRRLMPIFVERTIDPLPLASPVLHLQQIEQQQQLRAKGHGTRVPPQSPKNSD